MSTALELLQRLIAISSISRESNRGVIEFAEKTLIQAGWEFREHAYRDAAGIEKINLIGWPRAEPPAEMAFHLLLVCHTDTVPYGADWREATIPIEDEDTLKGCGACDVKGYLACILEAAGNVDAASLNKPLGILLTSDEEIGCVGARYLADRKLLSAKYAIVGEPTSLRPVRAGKGYCLAEITVNGREAHSAFPGEGKSAIYDGARLIVEIEKIAARLKEFPAEGFDPPYTTINIGEIHGGVAKNIVAPFCRFLLEWRPVAGQDPHLVAEMTESAISGLKSQAASFDCEFKILRMQEGFAVADESEVLSALLRASKNPAESVAFGTEAPWLNRLGAEAVVFGPGSMLSAHSPREFVPKAELRRCVQVLDEVIEALCK
jgi:acetylornithine deacetylase